MENQKEKELPLLGRNFRIRQFTPQDACYWVVQMFGSFLSIAKHQGGWNLSCLALVAQDFLEVDKAKWTELQNQCMRHVLIEIGGNWFPAIDTNGCPADACITAPVMMALTMSSFEFSMRPFFDPAVLDLVKALIPPSALSKIMDGLSSSSIPPSDSATGDSVNSGTEPTPSQTFST